MPEEVHRVVLQIRAPKGSFPDEVMKAITYSLRTTLFSPMRTESPSVKISTFRPAVIRDYWPARCCGDGTAAQPVAAVLTARSSIRSWASVRFRACGLRNLSGLAADRRSKS